MLLVSSCGTVLVTESLNALREEANPAIDAHTDALNNCLVPECNDVVLTGSNLIQILDIGLSGPQ